MDIRYYSKALQEEERRGSCGYTLLQQDVVGRREER